MYPHTYLSLFPAFPRDNRAFVAMSFDPRFSNRWSMVLEPAIRRVSVNGTALEPHRVDLRKASDSILTEILDGIARCRFFVADISVIAEIDGRTFRNANVLYEVGLAHSSRLPEEVLLLRSDSADLLFDVTNIRVIKYDPENDSETAQRIVVDAIVQSLRELDLKKSLAVRHAAQTLDVHSWFMLLEANAAGYLRHPPNRTMRDALGGAQRTRAVGRLLEIGALQAELTKLTPELVAATSNTPVEELVLYRVTEFGRALVHHALREFGADAPDIIQALDEAVRTPDPSSGAA